MPLLIEGLSELQADMQKLADKTSDGGSAYARTVKRVLTAGAEPMRDQMVQNATVNPKVISGTLRGSIRIGSIKKHRMGGNGITVGVHHKDGAYYANPVEFGHGGPAPAPAHPFVRPAYDKRADEAFKRMRDELDSALFEK